MQTKFTTQRLFIDILTTSDHEFICELVNTEGWLKFIGDRNVHSNEDAITYINKMSNTPAVTYWVVRLIESNIPIGIITFIKRAYLDYYDIGFAFLPKYEGNGYAYEATREVLSVLIQQPEHSIILATTLPGNVRSIRLLTKIGFQFEREIESHSERLNVYCLNRNCESRNSL
jgi:RimJ/RimL family protein N-acetyltransferase